ncbi:MAG: hypothetical protein WC335_09925 [Candidatus Omnitrophota bacterium]|jgi:hypothetical protein
MTDKKIMQKICAVKFEDVDIMNVGIDPIAIIVSAETTYGISERMGTPEKEIIPNDFIRVERDFLTGDYTIIIGKRMIDVFKYMEREKLI